MKAKRMLSMLLAVVMVFTILPVAIAADVQPTKTVEIQYVFKDGKTAASSWTASLAVGSGYTGTVPNPTVVGYEAAYATGGENENVTFTGEKIELNIQNIQQDMTITVTYVPAMVNYTVKYYQQNVDDDNYSLAGTATLTGLTGSKVNVTSEGYEGFYELLYDKDAVIAADGSTVVEVYYDRNYYLMTFNLGGGYGVEPVFARYGTPIGEVGTPERSGYTFTGWDVEIPQTMPAQNTSYTAQWTAKDQVPYTVVFWYENVNDDGYSYAGSVTQNAAPGSSVVSSSFQDTSFTGRDSAHFTYNADRAEKQTVNGDGSTVLNVYFNRNTYTLTFNADVLTCGSEEHTHSEEKCGVNCGGTSLKHWWHNESCYTCGKQSHTHTNSCYNRGTVKTITAKYGADIRVNFPIDNGTSYAGYWWEVPSGCTTFKPGNYLLSIDTMPGENITFIGEYKGKDATIWYYTEALTGATGEITYSGKEFDLYKSIQTVKNGNLTYAEEFHDITGFTQWKANPEFSSYDQNGKVETKTNNYLYYSRNSYNLKFYNFNAEVSNRGSSVQYEASLSNYSFTPAYPSGLEVNAYEFEGWYTTPACYEGTKVDFATAVMPANDLMLYAKWVPVSHTVEVYKDNTMVESVADSQTIPHGSFAEAPATPENGQYIFVGWFYMDNGVEKAFDFGSMPVRKDLKIYAKWSSNVLMSYTVRYAVEDANGTRIGIADPTTGSALAGSTKTFYAKGGDQLYGDYQEGYFPTTNSHSLTLDIADLDKNSYTFLYVQKDAVPYTVKYLDKETEKVLYDAKVVEDNRLAVVTETAVTISGYMPEVYQQRLVVTADGENVLIFYYVADTLHAMVTESHILLRDGLETPYSHTEYPGDIGTGYRASEMPIEGYVLDHAVANGVPYAPGDLVTLTGEGLHFVFYYKYNRFNVYYQSTQQTATYDMVDSFSVTNKVHEGYLYGGLYEDRTFTTPISDGSICGLEFAPEAGATYYVKEVSDSYLQPKIYYTYDMNSTPKNLLKGIYQVTAIDDLNYLLVGFDSTEDAAAGSQAVTANTVYQNITVMKRTSWASNDMTEYGKYNLQDFFRDLNSGYLGVRKYTGSVEPDQTIRFTPYFVTPDGVKVTGTVTRTVATNDGYCKGDTTNGMTVKDTQVVSKCTRYEAPASTASLLSLRSTYTLNWDEPAATSYTVTKVDGGETTTQMVDSGDQTGKITYAGQTGKLFAGWFTDSAYTVPADFSHVQADMTVYAKYISAGSVSTDVALKNKRSGELQGTVTMDEDLFSEVGLVWDYKGESEAVPASSKTVKRSLFSWIFGGETYQFSGVRNLAGLASRDTFTVTPYWVTQDGTVVHGAASTYMYYLNMIIRK